jgi:hypothetical protein
MEESRPGREPAVGERAGKEEPAAVGAGAGIVQQFAGRKDNGVETGKSTMFFYTVCRKWGVHADPCRQTDFSVAPEQ